MDLATVAGIIIAFSLVVGAIMSGGSLMLFVDFPSILIVLGGTIGATLINYPFGYMLEVLKVIRKTFFSSVEPPSAIIAQFMDYANRARREGILALEPVIKEVKDDYLRKGLQLTVDGFEPQIIQDILELEIGYREDRHDLGAEMMLVMGAFAPAMGMIGTVIGLVQMLQSMNDPSAIGPAMAVALITTFYGALLANLIFLPMAGKLKTRNKEEILNMEMILNGILCISNGDNPRIVAEKLNSFLPPKQRQTTD